MNEFFQDILRTVQNISAADVVDIACASVLIYFLYKFIRDRRSGKLVVGVICLIAIKVISDFFGMYVIQFILQNIFQVGLVVVAIVFQPELRSALEKVGGQPLKSLKSIGDTKFQPTERMINEVASAASELSQSRTGALIVFERLTRLGELILTGTVIDAAPSSFLIKNIFFNKAPLHDGALIIRDTRLYAAGCLLPLSGNMDIVKDLGTRHRAAIGMSENSDAVVVVVSEETGIISLAVEGVLYRGYSKETLTSDLKKYMMPEEERSQKKIRRIYKLTSRKTNKENNCKLDGSGGDKIEK